MATRSRVTFTVGHRRWPGVANSRREKIVNTKHVGSLSVAAFAGTALVGCVQQTPPPTTVPDPGPALGCYTDIDSFADVEILGAPGEPDGLEGFDPDTDCTVNSVIGAGTFTYVAAPDETSALSECTAIDSATTTVLDLTDWTDPAPGLAGYWVCSPK
jgi:hypothetical protein